MAKFPFLKGTAPNVVMNPEIAAQPTVFHSAGLALVCLFFVRTKYYFGWLVTEGSAVLAGFGYVPATKSWTGVGNVDVLSFEFATNISNAAKAWNQRTQSWLERYVYKRAPRAYQMNLTYFISAFWHGFYPGCVPAVDRFCLVVLGWGATIACRPTGPGPLHASRSHC
jgi:lysophospholipid acyltransferase